MTINEEYRIQVGLKTVMSKLSGMVSTLLPKEEEIRPSYKNGTARYQPGSLGLFI